jgi:adenylate kinase
MRKHVIVFGAPGSGKGTQSKLIAEAFNFHQMSTGDLLRAEVAAKSQIGKQCEAIIAQGKFPDNSIIFKLVESFIEKVDSTSGILYDGFPRTIDQAEFLLELLKSKGEEVSHIINVLVDKTELLKRILGRFTCLQCGAIYNEYFKPTKVENICDNCGASEFNKRADDSEETLKQRLTLYEDATAPILDYFAEQGFQTVVVDGMQSVDDVFHQIKNIL